MGAKTDVTALRKKLPTSSTWTRESDEIAVRLHFLQHPVPILCYVELWGFTKDSKGLT